MAILDQAHEIRLAPKYFYYCPRTRTALVRFLGSEFNKNHFTKRRLLAIYHAKRRKEFVE